jgi:hypothetical protein
LPATHPIRDRYPEPPGNLRFNTPVKKWAHELSREFSKEEVQMASKYMRKCSTSLAIKEMQVKATFRFHLTPVRMAITNGNNNRCW